MIEQPNTVFRNLGGMKFAALTAEADSRRSLPSRHRGSASWRLEWQTDGST